MIDKELLVDCAQLCKANSIEGGLWTGLWTGLTACWAHLLFVGLCYMDFARARGGTGNKKDNLTILYTPWANLKKQAGMETGQVTFHKDKMVKKIHIDTRVNAVVNRLVRSVCKWLKRCADEGSSKV